MSLAILPGMTLAQIAAVATSFRLNSGSTPPTTYANSVSFHDRAESVCCWRIFYIYTGDRDAFGACVFGFGSRRRLGAVVFYLQ